MTKNILVVENNPDYLKVAKHFFQGLGGVKTDFVIDYTTAKEVLSKYNGALLDIFIPESAKEKFGLEGKLLWTDLKKQVISGTNKYFFMALGRYAEYVLGSDNPIDALKIPSVRRSFDRCYATDSSSGRIWHALEKEEILGHAPLGIKLAKQAMKLDLPYCIVTDEHHHHPMIDVIVQVFQKEKLPFNTKSQFFNQDYGSKNEEKFWEAAYNGLIKQLSSTKQNGKRK